MSINPNDKVRAAAVCSEPGCESKYPDTDEVVVALWYGSDGLRDPISRKPKADGDFMLCRNCGTQYEVKADWPRSIETSAPAVPKFYGW